MRFFLIFSFLISSSLLIAQNPPVKWSFEAEKVKDGEYIIVATADIQDGWSVYSQEMDNTNGPIPTKIIIDEDNNLKVIGSVKEEGDKKTVYDELFEMELIKLSGRTSFRQRIKVKGDLDEISGQITFMTCCASSCLPPKDISFAIPLD